VVGDESNDHKQYKLSLLYSPKCPLRGRYSSRIFLWIDLIMDDDDYFSTNKSIQLTNCGGMSIVGLFARVFLVNLLSEEPERSWNQSLNSGMQNYLFS